MKLLRFPSILLLLTMFVGVWPDSPAKAEILISPPYASGDFQWAKSMGGVNDDQGRNIAVNSSGNVYTIGYFSGIVDFDPGVGTTNLTAVGGSDIFVSKLDSSGNFVWAKSMGGTGNDSGYGIAVDSSINVYTTGNFSGIVDFDPNVGISNLTGAGSNDIFISKLDSSGNFVWAKSMGGISVDISYGIAVDSSGDVVTTGGFVGTADFDPGAGTANLMSVGFNDIFISKLDGSGNFVWAKSMGSAEGETGLGVTVDLNGNVYTTGIYSLTVDFDPGANIASLTSAGNNDTFISKLDSDGGFIWAKSMGGTSDDTGFGIAIDSSGNLYTTGSFSGSADFDPGASAANLTNVGFNDIFISKLNSSGNFVWAKSMGGAGSDGSFGIDLDSSGNIYMTGYFSDTVDFDPGVGIANLTSTGSNDIFVSKLGSGGDLIWAKSIGGTGTDISYGLALDSSSNIYTTGYFQGTSDFDPGASTFNLTSVGIGDVFVSKLASGVAGPCSLTIAVANNHDADMGSLRQAIIDVCSGGTITFDPSLSSATIYLASPLIVDKNLIIDGSSLASQIQISGDTDNNGIGNIGVLNVNSGATVTLNSLTITKGYRTGGKGGGIYNSGTLNVINCTLLNNFAANGGGIANDTGSTMTVTDSSILDNSSLNDGGGIYNYGGALTLTRTTFSNNSSANYGGGGIANNTAPTNAATLMVTNSTISNNTTSGYGGGGIVNTGTLTVINSTIANNAATVPVADGGGIFNVGTATISNSTLSNNSAGRYGGGIYTGSTLHLKNTILANSTSGGDCYNYQGDIILSSTNYLIEANGVSGHKCGAPALTSDPKLGLLADNGSATQTLALSFDSPAIDAGHDSSCESADQRGIARPQGVHCDIGAFEYYQPNTMVMNTNNSGAGSLRQAIAETTPGGTITFDAALSGQTIHLASLLLIDKSLTIDGSSLASHIKISGDTDSNGIGDVSVFQINALSTVELNNLDIVKGKASGSSGGGGIANYGTLTVKNSTLSGNSYAGGIGGGGIYNKGILTIIDSTVTGNIAEDGGGIFNEYGHTLLITGSTFSNNSAQSASTLRGGGGGIANIGTLSVDDSIFLENIAYSGGGAIVNSIDGNSTVTNSSFTSNSSFGNGVGGAINNYEGSMTIDNCIFTGNSDIGGTTNRGGAVYNKDQMSITGSSFVENTSSRHGGGIANDATLTVTSSSITNNSADYGGGIANLGILTVINSNISGNSASSGLGAGGGILNDGNGILTVTNSNVSNNSSPNGGGIFNFSFTSTVNISSSTLSGNTVPGNGGGISNWGTLTSANSTFFGNSAAIGGGIFNLGTSIVTNSTISTNSASTSGGGIYSAGTLSYANTIIANSTNGVDCTNDGGTIGTNSNNLVENNALSPSQCGTPSLTGDPKLGSLADNGGSTLTMSLLPGSAAIDAGDDAVCAAAPVNNTSQNGVTRPVGAHCDIGSFEYVDTTPPTVSSILRANPSPTAATTVDFTVTFSEMVTGVNSADFTITKTGVSGVTISGVGGSGKVYTVTVNTGIGEGTIRLDVPVSAIIKDLSNNSLNGLPYISGQTYSISKPLTPKAPVLRSPRTNSIANDSTPTFWWTNTRGAQTYEIEFAADNAFVSGIKREIVNETTYTSSVPFIDGKYYWHVRAYNAVDQSGSWSSIRSFTIDTSGPLAPIPSSPTDNASSNRTPTFKWARVSGAVLYEFQYDNDLDFSSPTYTVAVRSTFRRPPPMGLGTYYWHVRAKDALGNWGIWSATRIINITSP